MIKVDLHSAMLSKIGTPVLSAGGRRKAITDPFMVEQETDVDIHTVAAEDAAVTTTRMLEQLSKLNPMQSLGHQHQAMAVGYGDQLLTHLKQIQYHLLADDLSAADLTNLDQLLNDQPVNVSEGLQDIISDIQVRVAVELAKRSYV